ncbi:glutathione binding-like protein [Piscinibacter sakaiensis]|uniref:Glutathione S-transferase n=1 Tax=Piscinibacter sakaiensis TaxID=1547922 RepID=A0A0K8P5D3_PISS1|nr:glutathione binding-like protein [Piscinibacter sakaiensis]GAP37923.1 glutathione S-transferase [Piscinibacter sakaiensis]
MLDLHYWPTPNGWKITIMLEECGLPYRVVPVNIGRGEQFDPAFLAIGPNNRIPALVDHAPADGGEPLSVFESGAILQYLAGKAGRLLPEDPRARMAALSWLNWQMGGLGPMLGQHGHFLLYAREKLPYAIERYGNEARRLYGVMDRRLGQTGAYLAGDAYSIADIACFPWIMTHKAQQLTLDDFPHVRAWFARVRARPAVQRGLAVGKEWRTGASPATDEESRKHLFGTRSTTGGAG